jgi:acetyltransferase-like isoleucine patch superfamily enzyme
MNDTAQLLDNLRQLRDELSDQMHERFDRDLPLEELLFDRWGRARRLGFGDHASIYQSALVFGQVAVGEHTWIGPFVLLDGQGGIEIGSYCSISAGVHIYTHDTVRWSLSGGRARPELGSVRIGDCTYVGSQTVVTRGAQIGDHCVIGANSLVRSHIPAYSVAFGAPARVRGRVHLGDGDQVELRIDPVNGA